MAYNILNWKLNHAVWSIYLIKNHKKNKYRNILTKVPRSVVIRIASSTKVHLVISRTPPINLPVDQRKMTSQELTKSEVQNENLD